MPVKITCIGGGHGLLQVAKAVRYLENVDIAFIVTVFDDGGDTGKLRIKYNIPAVGDIRKLITELTSLRFLEEKTKCGHKLGNMLLTHYIMKYGVCKGVKKLCEDLNIKEKIIPVSEDNSFLVVKTISGKIVKRAESKVEVGLGEKIIDLWLEPEAKISEEAKQRIIESDIILIGPGSFVGSVMVHFAVKGFVEALKLSWARKYFFVNISMDPEIYGYTTAQELIDFVKRYVNGNAINYYVINNNTWHEKHIKPFTFEKNVILHDLASDTEYNRHDPKKLAYLLEKIINTVP